MKKGNYAIICGFLALCLSSCGEQIKKPDEEIIIPNPNENDNQDDKTDVDKDTNPDQSGNVDKEDNKETGKEDNQDPNKDETTKPDTKPVLKDGEFKAVKSNEMAMTYEELSLHNEYNGLTPSIGSPNVIVVPINFSDLRTNYSFSTSNLNVLETAFKGNNIDGTTGYWESVNSFYKKSSYGKLDIQYTIADPFVPNMTSQEFINYEEQYDGLGTNTLCEEVYKNLKVNNQPLDFNDPKYDANDDGFIDGIWFIYNSKEASEQENYWPYVYWYMPSEDKYNDCKISVFGNMSVSFLYDADIQGRDAHTLIHESGHMLGLDDYYTYDTNFYGQQIPSASGEYDMMDRNIGDHCSYSKASLGWLDLKVPTKPGKFTLKPLATNNEAIVLANPNTFNGSAFDEYLILDYYQPLGLNQLDAEIPYMNSTRHFTEPGLRIWHIDSRIAYIKLTNGGYIFSHYVDLNKEELLPLGQHNGGYIVGHSNTRSRDVEGKSNEDLLALIPQDNQLIYQSRWELDNKALFRTGDSFNSKTYKKFFKGGKFNNGSSIDWKVKVLSVNKDNIELEIDF